VHAPQKNKSIFYELFMKQTLPYNHLMIEPTIRNVRTQHIIIFIVGILILALGASMLYQFITRGLSFEYIIPAVGIAIIGLILMITSSPIFIPLKKKPSQQSVACPYCGALVEEDAEVCVKCKHQLQG
jgi:hypothetical protein